MSFSLIIDGILAAGSAFQLYRASQHFWVPEGTGIKFDYYGGPSTSRRRTSRAVDLLGEGREGICNSRPGHEAFDGLFVKIRDSALKENLRGKGYDLFPFGPTLTIQKARSHQDIGVGGKIVHELFLPGR